MKQFIREPLLHFLLLGAAIFVVYSLVSKGSAGEGGSIVVTKGQLASIWEGFTRTRQREPTRDEWDGLIRARVREEVYYREALALGLDKDDTVIRRRLQQKMEFVSDDLTAQAQPADAELNAYLQAHRDMFRVEPRLTFRQIFLDPQKRRTSVARDAGRLLEQLNQAHTRTEIPALGDPFMLGQRFDALTAGDIARQFGETFAKAMDGLSPGQWHGPIASSFGVHLVFVSGRTEARPALLADVRDAVRREWDEARRREVKEQSYQKMLKRYSVSVEAPGPTAAAVTTARLQ